jgi:CubicO group peptidase (beta-lactamase class C family)
MIARLLRIAALLAAVTVPARAQDPAAPTRFVGTWEGTLDVNGSRVRLALIIERDTAGGIRGHFTNLDAGNLELPATVVARGDTLTTRLSSYPTRYVAVIDRSAATLTGTYSIPDAGFPLVLRRVAQLSAATAIPYPARLAADADIRAVLKKRVDQQRTRGIVVGVIDPDGRRIITYGERAKGDPTPLDGNTLFEIGSVTKVFTTLLLTEMVRRGDVALSDPAAKYLPDGWHMPERDGRQITLLDLATHTSGLPRDATNLPRFTDAANPFAGFTPALLGEFLSSYKLPRAPEARYEYSNVGMGTLGYLLARRAGMTYDALVRSRISDRLGMSSTRGSLDGTMVKRAARGHAVSLDAVPPLDIPVIEGAGVLRSTANDMLTFVSDELGVTDSPLRAAMSDALATRRPTGMAGLEVALGWHITTISGHEIVWHNGGTPGFRAFVGFDRARRVGVVALSNSGAAEGVDDIGMWILAGGGPLFDRAPAPTITVDSKTFDTYVGRYQLAPGIVMEISRDADRSYVQLTGQPRFEIYASAPREYFLKVVDARISFEVDSTGKSAALVLHQNGRDQRAPRIVP